MDTSDIFSFTRNGITVEFFRKDPVDTKFSFRIKGDEETTARLLAGCKRTMIAKRSINHALGGIFTKINQIISGTIEAPVSQGLDETSRFVHMYQKKFGRSPKFLETREGVSSASLYGMQVITPTGETFLGVGKSKKSAKLALAKGALELLSVPQSTNELV